MLWKLPSKKYVVFFFTSHRTSLHGHDLSQGKFTSFEEIYAEIDLGDGECNLDHNIEKYDFDLGDCCLDEVKCLVQSNVEQPDGAYIEVECPENKCIRSNVFCNLTEIGDGICQDYNNAALCDYDGGDCCLNEKGLSCCKCECKTKLKDEDFLNGQMVG